MKIPVHYYMEISGMTVRDVADYFVNRKCYVKNLNGKTYLVEVLA